MNISKYSLLACAFALPLTGLPTLKADIIVNESFDYTPTGSPLDGQSGGTGWNDNPWLATNGATVSPENGLSHPGVYSSGSSLFTGNQSFRDININTPVTASSGSIYVGYLVSQNAVAYTNIGIFNYTGSQETTFGDVWDGGSAPISNYGFRTNVGRLNGAPDLVTSTTPIDISGATHFMVMELDYSTPGQTGVYVYLDPDTSSSALDHSTAFGTFTLGEQLQFDHIRVENFSSAGTIDEIRIATSYGEILSNIAVPEPSTVALAGLGIFGMLFLVRRKRTTDS